MCTHEDSGCSTVVQRAAADVLSCKQQLLVRLLGGSSTAERFLLLAAVWASVQEMLQRGVTFAPASRTQRIRDLVSTLSLEDEGGMGSKRRTLDVRLPDTLVPWGKRTIQRLSATGHTPRRTLGRLAPVGQGAKPRRPTKPSDAPLDKAKTDWACGECGYQYNAMHTRACVACAGSSAPLDPPAHGGRAVDTPALQFELPVVQRFLARLECDAETTCQETIELLHGVLQDIVRQPRNLHFRRLRLTNSRISALLREGPGAAAASRILAHVGFGLAKQSPPGRSDAPAESVLQLPIRDGDTDRCLKVCKLFGDWLLQRRRNAEALFSAIDVDGDGSLTISEMKAKLAELGFSPAQAEAFFQKIDADGDGNATRAEFIAALATMGSDTEEVRRFTEKRSSGLLQKKVTGAGGVDTWETYNSELSSLELSMRPDRGADIFLRVNDISNVCRATSDEDAFGLPLDRVFVITQRSDGTKHFLAATSVEDRRAWIHQLAIVRMPTLIENSQCGFSARWLLEFVHSDLYVQRMAELRATTPADIQIIRGPQKVAADDPRDFKEGTWATYVQLPNSRCVWANSPATAGDTPPSAKDLIDTWLLDAPASELPYISQTRCLWETVVEPTLFGPGESRKLIHSAGSYAEYVFKNDQASVSSGALGQINLFVSQSLQGDVRAMLRTIEDHCMRQNVDTRDVFCWLDGLSIWTDLGQETEQGKSYERANRLIGECGHTLAVVHPGGMWHPHSWLQRIWCIQEVYESLKQGVQVSMGLSEEQLQLFKSDLTSDPEGVAVMLSCVDIRKAKGFDQAHKQMIVGHIEAGDARQGSALLIVNLRVKEYLKKWIIDTAKTTIDDVESRHRVDIDGDGDVGITDDGIDLGAQLPLKSQSQDTAQNEADCRTLMSYVDLVLNLQGPSDEATHVCIEAIRLASGMEVCKAPVNGEPSAALRPTGELMELHKYKAQQMLVRKLISNQEFCDSAGLVAILEESGHMLVDAHWRTSETSVADTQSTTTTKAVVLSVMDCGKQLRVLFANAVMQTVPVDWVLSEDWQMDALLSDYTGLYNNDAATGLLPDGHEIVLRLRDRLPDTCAMSTENVISLRRELADKWIIAHGPTNEGSYGARVALAQSLAGTDSEEARDIFDEIMPEMLRALGPNNRLMLKTKQAYANLLTTLDEHEAARSLLETVVAGYVAIAPSRFAGNLSHPLILKARHALAKILEQLNETMLARMEYEAVIRGHVEMRGPDDPNTLAAKCGLVVLKHRQLNVASRADQFIDSIALMQQCAESAACSPAMGPEHPQTKQYQTLLERWTLMQQFVSQGKLRYNPNSAWTKIAPTDGSSTYWVAQASTGLANDGDDTRVQPWGSAGQVRRDTEPDEGVKDVQQGPIE